MRPLAVAVLLALSLTACVPRPPDVPGRIERVTRSDSVPGVAQDITLLARSEPGGGILATVINAGDRPIRLSRDLFTLTPGRQLAAGAGASPGLVQLPQPPRGALAAQALPEGVLEPGVTARGLLFFPAPPDGEAHLQARLVDAATGRTIDIVTTAVER